MKCLCGYEYKTAWQSDDGNRVGDEEFIRVDFGRYPTIQIEVRYGDDRKTVDVYACPKCGTLKIDV